MCEHCRKIGERRIVVEPYGEQVVKVFASPDPQESTVTVFPTQPRHHGDLDYIDGSHGIPTLEN